MTVVTKQKRVIQLVSESLRRIEEYARAKNYCDYDQWFLLDSIIDKVQRYKPYMPFKLAYYGLDKLFSLSAHGTVYRVLKVPPVCDPKNKIIFIKGYLKLYEETGNRKYLSLAHRLGYELTRKHLTAYKDAFVLRTPWRHYVNAFGISYYDKNVASMFLTALAGDALIDLYSFSADSSFLDAASKIGNFFLYPETYDSSGNNISYYYVLGSSLHIHNANVFAGAFLTRLYKVTGNNEYLENGKRAIAYTLCCQNDDGSWYYYGFPECHVNKTIDNYHTGFVLMAFIDSYNTIGGEKLKRSIQRGLKFYRSMFTISGAPKPTPNKHYPQNIHSSAQGIITFIKAKNFDRQALEMAKKILIWTIYNLRSPSGLFYYEINELRRLHKGTFLRYCQSWMFYALALALKEGVLDEDP